MTTELSGNDHEGVEVKYRVGDLRELTAAPAQQGLCCRSRSRRTIRRTPPAGWSYGISKIRVPFARLRTQDGRHLFTVKKPIDNEMAWNTSA